MWNRRDALVMATAAVATFGLTVGTLWPRLANAVDGAPAPTRTINTPTLTLGPVQVTAALDAAKTHTVLFTVRNTSDAAAKGQFTASASVTAPSSAMSRVGPPSSEVWSQEYSVDLKAGETQVIAVSLPDQAYVLPAEAQTQGGQQAASTSSDNNTQRLTSRMIPGRSYLTLRGDAQRGMIRALTLSDGAVIPQAAAAQPAPQLVAQSTP